MLLENIEQSVAIWVYDASKRMSRVESHGCGIPLWFRCDLASEVPATPTPPPVPIWPNGCCR